MREFHDSFETLQEVELKDIHSMGYLLRHKKTKAIVTLISNDDENKVFYIGFRTPPKDSTGVAHIIEHTVLCGSEKYPLKDPFVELVKGSLNTFINAITYPDKTLYPIASTNDQDFKNLMDVYMDAVFHPNIYKIPEIFKQEGWHYELDDKDGDIKLNGVVYNEMKGAFSSPDDVLERQIMNTLFTDTTYGNESGGDPDVIPELTREDYLNFHRKYYHPSNSFIYLYGDMDMEERLDYLDKEYLSKYDYLEVNSEIELQKPFDKPVEVNSKYSINSDEDTEGKTYLSENYVIGDSDDLDLIAAFSILDYALLSSPGAPLEKALLDAKIGEDITGGFDSGTRQPVFSVIAKNCDSEKRAKFLSIIEETLKKVRDEGIDKDTLKAGIAISKFRFLESDYGSAPKGLIYGIGILDTWLYDKENSFGPLFSIERLNKLEERIDEGYFEKLIDKYLLNNTHKSIVCVDPEPGQNAKKDAALKEKLKEYKKTLSSDEIEKLIEDTKKLRKFQEDPTPDEDLRKIPLLERKDLRREITPLTYKKVTSDGVDILHSDVETNGIHYVEVHFRPRGVKENEIPVISFYTKLLGLVDTKKHSYQEYTTEVNKYTGGIDSNIRVFTRVDKKPIFTFFAKTKMLLGNEDKAIELMMEMLFDSVYTDKNRVKELLLQEKAQMEAMMQSAGHNTAALRAGSYFTDGANFGDKASGIDYYRYLCAFIKNFDTEYEKFKSTMEGLLPRIFRSEGMLISATGKEETLKLAKKMIPVLKERLAENDKKSFDDEMGIVITGRPLNVLPDPLTVNEGFKTAGSVQYVCRAGDFRKAGFTNNGAMKILKVILGYDYFWVNVRVKGGAYGCMSGINRSGLIHFVSYRDPNLGATIDIFEKTAKYLEEFDVDERTMTKYIIGTFSSMDTPLTPKQKGQRDLAAYFAEVTNEEMQRVRSEVLDATCADIRALAPVIRSAMSQGYLCVIGSENAIADEKDRFAKVRNLIEAE
ncbi:MAG: insulinase family protein [Lachnospiraceae bacterium]|nr:insulinase family protein [Lachnospiraceae bacterium]